MSAILKIGEKVNIHHFLGSNERHPSIITGIVESYKMSDDLSYHGSPWYEEIYTVLGDDGKYYHGTAEEDYLHYFYGWHTYFTRINKE